MRRKIRKAESNQHCSNKVIWAYTRMVELRMEKMQWTLDLGERSKREESKVTQRYQQVSWGSINVEVVSQVIKMKEITERKEWNTMRRSLGNYYVCGTGR